MKTPTYEQQWQKITAAYIKGEIEPYDANFCFCGTLCDNDRNWSEYDTDWSAPDLTTATIAKHCNYKGYSAPDFVKMEAALLETISEICNNGVFSKVTRCNIMVRNHPNYETALFNGMVAALEVLRQIHAERGDVTAIEMPLVKRELNASL